MDVQEWCGVRIGAWADSVLEIHPRSEFVRKPTVHEAQNTLIVTWHYPQADVTLEYASIPDPFRPVKTLSVYAVQKIVMYDKPQRKPKKRRRKR